MPASLRSHCGDQLGMMTITALAAKQDMKQSPSTSEEYEVKPADSVKPVWTLWDSIWVPRTTESESKDFYDSDKLHKRAFNLDWGRCVQKGMFSKFLSRLAPDRVAEETEEIRREVWEDYDVIGHAFDFYACCSGGDGFSVKLNAYNDFLTDCYIPEEKEKKCNKQIFDQIFVVVNVEDTAMTKQENDVNADRELQRFEWVEVVVRAAIAKYVDTGRMEDPSDAIDELCEKNILAHLEPAAAHNRNDFRRERLYVEEVDDCFRPRLKLLAKIFDLCSVPKPQIGTKVMNIQEFVKFMEVLGFYSSNFTKREARLCFCWSKMKYSDELKNNFKWTHMFFLDFLEALARATELMSIPTDEQIERYGFANVVEYELGMTNEDLDAEREAEAVSTDAEQERPLAERLEKFLMLMWARYDTTGGGVVTETDIFRYHKEGKGIKIRAR